MSGPFSVNPSGDEPPPTSESARLPSRTHPDGATWHGHPQSNDLPHGAGRGEDPEGGGGDRRVLAAIVAVVTLFVILGIVISLLLARATGPDEADSDAGPQTTSPAPTAAPSETTAVDATTSPPTDGAMVTESCRTVEGIVTRECTVVIPPGTPADAELPAVILLHGFGVPGWEVRSAGRWNQAQKDRDFIVVTPEGPFMSWNAGGCCGFSVSTGVNDVAYLDDLIERTAARPDVDPERIFMVGASNGGMMTWRYLCANDGTVKKAAIQAGTPVSECVEENPVETLHIHGTADQVVPYAGGQSVAGVILNVQFADVPGALEERATGRGCGTPVEGDADDGVTLRTWSECDDGAEISLYTLEGGIHDWPAPAVFPATDTILDFFEIE